MGGNKNAPRFETLADLLESLQPLVPLEEVQCQQAHRPVERTSRCIDRRAVKKMRSLRPTRVIVPYTRGFGPPGSCRTRSRGAGSRRPADTDIIELINALGIERPILGGFDWGGNASCVAAALWPERIRGLVSYAGYDIIDVNGWSVLDRAAIQAQLY